jgi:FdhD protein
MGFRSQTAKLDPCGDLDDCGAVVGSPVTRFTGVQAHPEPEMLAVEEPLEIQLGYGVSDTRMTKSVSVTMRTPGHDFELAAGFLMTEGVVSDLMDITQMHYVQAPARLEKTHAPSDQQDATQRSRTAIWHYQPMRNIVRVELSPDVNVNVANLERNFYTTSSCGICGKASLLALHTVCPPRAYNQFSIDPALLYKFPERLRSAQDMFLSTGGLHAAGLFDADGGLHSLREDVGRHNAVDKLLGAAFLTDNIPLRDRLLMLSGRASFELLQKGVMSGIPMVVSVGAPSSLAVEVAREFDVILVGFLREDHFNVYHGVEHLKSRSQEVGGVHHEITD